MVLSYKNEQGYIVYKDLNTRDIEKLEKILKFCEENNFSPEDIQLAFNYQNKKDNPSPSRIVLPEKKKIQTKGIIRDKKKPKLIGKPLRKFERKKT